MIDRRPFTPLPQLDQEFLRNPNGSYLEQGALPIEPSSVSVVIPTNFRYTVNGNQVETFGPLPQLVQSLVAAGEREGVNFRLHLVDDTTPEKADDKKIATVLAAAVHGNQNPPDIFIFGRQERAILYDLLDQRLPSDIDRETLHHLVTHWGYGPQRVRGDMITAGSPTVISFDDDLIANGVTMVKHEWMQRNGLEQAENAFVYMGKDLASDPDVVENVTAEYLLPYLRILGKTPAELIADPDTFIASGTKNTKDAALRSYLASGKVSVFQTSHNNEPGDFDLNTRIGIATGRKQGIPDINAGVMLLHGINNASEGDKPLDIRAVPAGKHTSYVMSRDTNPDCAVMGRDMTTAASQLPWLLSNPDISAQYNRVKGPYRAEDRLFTVPPSDIVMASIPVIKTHNRSELGFRGGIVSDFFSEELGDVLGDEVLQHLDRDPHTGSLIVRMENGSFQLSPNLARGIYDKTIEKIIACQTQLAELTGRNTVGLEAALSKLQGIIDNLQAHVKNGFDAFYASIDAEISQQMVFVREEFKMYQPLMQVTQEIREEGNLPIRIFRK